MYLIISLHCYIMLSVPFHFGNLKYGWIDFVMIMPKDMEVV